VIGFGAGEPDFPTPGPDRRRGPGRVRGPQEPPLHPRRRACPSCAAAVAEKTERDSGLEITAGQVLITNGGKQAVYQAFATLLDPGDEVILPAPYWTTYPEAITLAGGVPVVVTTGPGRRLPALGRAARGRTNSAHQGAAVVLAVEPDRVGGLPRTHRGRRALGRRARRLGRYRRNLRAPRLRRRRGGLDAGAVPELAETCVVLNGVAKTYAMTGWRVGWMAGPADVVKAATNLQ
jgi:aspartate/methionine/tyrosine aminotransferase